MNIIGILLETRGGIPQTQPPEPPTSQTIIDTLDDPALALISHWRLNEQLGSVFADRETVADMVATGEPQRLTTTIISNDVSAECIALDGVDDFLQAINPASKPYDVTAGAMGLVVQVDTAAPLKQHLLNRHGVIAGAMALEYLSGGQIRGWRSDGTGTTRQVFSSIGAVRAGDSHVLTLAWGAAGLQIFRGGTLIASEAVPTTNWAVDAALNSNICLGRWGGSAVDFLDAVVSQAFFLGAQPTGPQLEALTTAVSIAWAEAIDAGSVNASATANIILKSSGAHFKAPIVPVVDVQGSLGTASVDGEELDYVAGATVGFDDIVVYHFTSANGAMSQTANITIDVAAAVAEFPLTTPGTAGWVSTTHSNFGSPAHGAAIENLPNVADAAPLFTQASAPLRGTWDSTTFDVDVIRSDGTQFYTKATALGLPSLVIIGAILDADTATDSALAGAASTQTPGVDPQEDAWHVRRTGSTLRGVAAAAGGIAFTDVPVTLAEKLLIVMEITGNQLTIWRNGLQSVSQTISGARIATDGAQALFARYYNNAIVTGKAKGGILEYYQNTAQKTKAQIRQYIEYYQTLIWPSVTAPSTATLDAGDVEQGETLDFDVIAALAAEGIVTTGMTLVSIHEQPGSSGVTVSVVGGLARITVAAGATLGNTSFVYCVQRATA